MSGPGNNQSDDAQRDVVIERFAALGRQLSQATVLFHEQIAEHVGLSATDHKCLDLAVQAERPLTAGQIAELLSAAIALAAYFWQVGHPTPTLAALYEQVPQWGDIALDFGPRLDGLLKACAAGLAVSSRA